MQEKQVAVVNEVHNNRDTITTVFNITLRCINKNRQRNKQKLQGINA